MGLQCFEELILFRKFYYTPLNTQISLTTLNHNGNIINNYTSNTLFQPVTPSGSRNWFSISSAHIRSSMKNL